MHTPPPRPRLAISACLLGANVRYNGGHKASRLCLEELGEHFDFVPLCPEVAIGLGIPRPTLRLVETAGAVRALESREASRDHSDALRRYGDEQARQLEDIGGYIFMQKSPSCGLQRVKLYSAGDQPLAGGARGLYAEAFCAARPELPVEEEGRLHDATLRENFITRVYAHLEWQALCRAGLTHKAILDFHSRYKYQLLAHSPRQYAELGHLLADIGRHAAETFGADYYRRFAQAMRHCASRGNHANVLLHLAGYLKRALAAEDRGELCELIDQYRRGVVPLVVPLALLKHHFRRHPHPYIARQAYLQPHPEALGLRNAI
ncbi:DUF1722 domain-containing protein [Pseudomonas citronellolis]|uniref:DUF1722 domain-containing protein n=1 Tax=Pseudomonas citronellolis TaxID=53408 RepID=UPI0023E3AD72|nr:DUF1722 domain-containing protein [Pseudomonas citronellolis]MDF3933292.1 DUF1722 domain-containing protein [Pseudomonas citronellolis]